MRVVAILSHQSAEEELAFLFCVCFDASFRLAAGQLPGDPTEIGAALACCVEDWRRAGGRALPDSLLRPSPRRPS